MTKNAPSQHSPASTGSIIALACLPFLLPCASAFDVSRVGSTIESVPIDLLVRDVARKATTSIVAPLLLASASLTCDSALAYPLTGDNSQNTQMQSLEKVISSPSTQSPTDDNSNDSSSSSLSRQNPTENYLPRRLYPGTYKNYCGPTPETQIRGGCVAHGWYGDAPADAVDAACQQHDVAYCNCETQLLSRQRGGGRRQETVDDGILVDDNDDGLREEKEIPLLSSMAALRFATKTALERTVHADAQYFDCVNKADRQLIATGIRIRGEQQRSGCSTDPNLAWFCDLDNARGTLAAFERVNLGIFLADLDADDGRPPGKLRPPLQFVKRWRVEEVADGRSADETLSQLEKRRAMDLQRNIRSGRAVADAASSEDVLSDEERILLKLVTEAEFN